MKKPLRFAFAGFLAVVLLIVGVVAFGLTPTVQTWAARRATKGQGIEFGRVAAGLNAIHFESIRVIRPGLALTLPLAEVDVSLLDAARSHVAVKRIVAKGWTLDLTSASADTTAQQPSSPTAAVATARTAFEGLFKQLKLPVDFSLDTLEIEGDVILPEGRVHVVLTGGQLAAGQDGAFTLKADGALLKKDAPVSTIVVRSEIHVRMDTARSFEHFTVATHAMAKGAQFPDGVGVDATMNAVRTDKGGESYSLLLKTDNRELASIDVQLSAGAAPLTGMWKIDARDTDLAPFTLGRTLPIFTATGQGTFSTDRMFSEIHAAGRLGVAADRLASISSQLSAIGSIKLTAEFDVSQRGDVIRVERLTSTISGERPVLLVEALQVIELNSKTHGVTAANPANDLFHVSVQGVPLVWAQPFIPSVAITGDDLHGEFSAAARDGGFNLSSVTPLTLTNLNISQAGKPLVRALDLLIGLGADYTPKGWQADVTEFSARSGEKTLAKLAARVGRPAGENQPVKATGTFEVSLPALLDQPAAPTGIVLSQGVARGEFTATWANKQEIALTLQLAELAVVGQPLPEVAVYMRADRDATGRIDAQIPVSVTQTGRKSDLLIGVVVQPAKTGVQVDAQLKSEVIYIEDLKRFAGLVPAPAPAQPTVPVQPEQITVKTTAKTAGPPWAGISGELKLALKKVVYSSAFQLTDIGGSVKITPAMLSLENLRVVLGADGNLKAVGSLNYDATVAEPYGLKADINVIDFDLASLLRSLDPSKPVSVEGKFDLATHLAGRADDLAGFKDTALGDVTLTCRGGILRALGVKAGNTASSVSKVSAVIGLFGALTGNTMATKYAERGQAAADAVQQLGTIKFDQLNVVVARDARRDMIIKEITLISPAVRLAGSGKITYSPGVALTQRPLAINLQLSAQDRLADAFRTLRLLGSGGSDELGYFPLVEPIKLDGTLQSIGTSQLDNLINRALAN